MIHNEDPLYCIFNHRKINLQFFLSLEDPLKFGKGWVVENLSEKEELSDLYAQTFFFICPPPRCKSTDWSESMTALLHHSSSLTIAVKSVIAVKCPS